MDAPDEHRNHTDAASGSREGRCGSHDPRAAHSAASLGRLLVVSTTGRNKTSSKHQHYRSVIEPDLHHD